MKVIVTGKNIIELKRPIGSRLCAEHPTRAYQTNQGTSRTDGCKVYAPADFEHCRQHHLEIESVKAIAASDSYNSGIRHCGDAWIVRRVLHAADRNVITPRGNVLETISACFIR